MVRIYALLDPVTGEPRYVGKTTQSLRGRLACHLSHSRHRHVRNQHFYVYRWIRTLLAAGLEPSIKLLEEATDDTWADRERYWIRRYREAGIRLTNTTPGGEGLHGYQQTPQHRRRIGLANRGEDNGSARLTENQAREIYQLTRTRERTQKQIAYLYGVSLYTVRAIAQGTRWKHLSKESHVR